LQRKCHMVTDVQQSIIEIINNVDKDSAGSKPSRLMICSNYSSFNSCRISLWYCSNIMQEVEDLVQQRLLNECKKEVLSHFAYQSEPKQQYHMMLSS